MRISGTAQMHLIIILCVSQIIQVYFNVMQPNRVANYNIIR